MPEAEARQRIERYIRDLVAQESLPVPGVNIFDFLGLVQNAIASRQASEDVPEDKRLLVLMEDPPEHVDTEAITFYLNSRTPGQLNQGPVGANRVKEVRAHIRSTVQHPDHLGEKLITAGKYYDNSVTFNIYARNNKTALRRVLWFEEVMDTFEWYFRLYRTRVIEQGAGEKKDVIIGEMPLVYYPMSYFVRTEYIYQFGSQELRRLVLNLDVATTSEED